MKTELKLSDLNKDQKDHLAYRLDHNTACGLGTACSVARGEHGDLSIRDIFIKYGNLSERSATIFANKVKNFKVDEEKRLGCELGDEIVVEIHEILRNKPVKSQILALESIVSHARYLIKLKKELNKHFGEGVIESVSVEVK